MGDIGNIERALHMAENDSLEPRVGKLEAAMQQLQTDVAVIKSNYLTKDDLSREIGGLRDDLHREVGGLRDDLRREIGGVREDLQREVGSVREDLQREIGGMRKDLHVEIGGLRGELHRAINDQTWKVVTWTTGLGVALVAATFFIARNVQP